jgi:hypothetical protein
MFHFKPLKLQGRQGGTVLIEVLLHVGLIVFMTALLLQVGRTFVLFNVTASAAYSAAMHLATMPEAELLDPLVAKPNAVQILTRMRNGAGIDVSLYPFSPTFSCTPNPSAPCLGNVKPTQVHVRVTHTQKDTIFPAFTEDVDHQINELEISYRARIPRVGFYKL